MYLLDTNICSYLMRRRYPALTERVRVFPPRELKISVVTVFELEFGILRSGRVEALRRIVNAFLENVEVLPWTEAAAQEAGAVRAELAGRGRPIGAYDVLIAGHARSLGAVLVTHNRDEFSRVDRLTVEDWVAMA